MKKLKILLITLIGVIFFAWLSIYVRYEFFGISKSIGQHKRGQLINGKRLPLFGENYKTYSYFSSLILFRTYVHDYVRDTMIDSFKSLETLSPGYIFKYGETGMPWGKRLWPHHTHQKGLSVDIFVPIKQISTSKPLIFPTWPWQYFGYNIHFNKSGVNRDMKIDFEALANIIFTLENEGKKHGLEIEKVVFRPNLQKYLFNTNIGKQLKEEIKFSKTPYSNPLWWHDNHIHVNFKVTE